MKFRLAALICLLNITVLGVGYFWVSRYFKDRIDTVQDTAQEQLEGWKATAEAVRSTPVAPTVIYQTNPFRWSELESTDYRQYIANLRAVGCPEVTLRDIIMTDVMRLYAARRGQFFQNGRPFKYWETDEKRKLKQGQLEDREAQLAQIDKELPAVLRELLGINYEREMNKYFVNADEDDRKLAFLSQDKRSQVLALRDQFEGKREKVLWQAQNRKLNTDDLEQLKNIDEEQDRALGNFLTANEKQEFDLTSSPTADRMRRELIGFNPTEAEFQEIFKKEQALDEAYAYQDTNDPAVRAARAADEEKMQAEIADTLGPDRAAQYQQAQNPDYQNLCVLAERYDLPPQTSQTLLDMRQSAEAAKKELLGNPGISADQRTQALQAIQAETERAARATLGPKAYADYSQGAAWIRGLGAQ